MGSINSAPRKTIYISGMHSGQSPMAGLGIARCLRAAFPEIKIVGVDHWQGSSGLHDPVLDEVLILPQWKQVNEGRHWRKIQSLLDEGHAWISSLDVEIRWIAQASVKNWNSRALLVPGEDALKSSAKPEVRGLSELGFRVPEFISANESDSVVHQFLRENAWRCWLKTPFHDAKRVCSWSAFLRLREATKKAWKTNQVFLQKHRLGSEESISFCALEGELLDAIHMVKRLLTPEGKTWAGRVEPLEGDLRERLAFCLKALNWNGGGEIEFVRDNDQNCWMIECNPRFPAWIYGAALVGRNLPAKLIGRLWGLPMSDSRMRFPCFTRVVQEIPAREGIGLPWPTDSSFMGWPSDGKLAKGASASGDFLPPLREETSEKSGASESDPDQKLNSRDVEPRWIEEVNEVFTSYSGGTPARLPLPLWSSGLFQEFGKKIRVPALQKPEIRLAYSVKTSPTRTHLELALKNGLLAECISQFEIQRALEIGFKADQIILNGPGKFWPLGFRPVGGLQMLFCDSVEEFERVANGPSLASGLGFRLKLPSLGSRFGNSLGDFLDFQSILSAIPLVRGRAKLGFHFHMASWSIGMSRWKEAFESLLLWCKSAEGLTDVPVRALDLGGGFFPGDFERLDLSWIHHRVRSVLASVDTVYFEPGRALSQDTEILVSRVLDIRKSREGRIREVVIDASVAELPMVHSYPHRVFYSPSGPRQLSPLKSGDARILGRICMEDDVLATGVSIPEQVSLGNYFVFGDAGAYERSMTYAFGAG